MSLGCLCEYGRLEYIPRGFSISAELSRKQTRRYRQTTQAGSGDPIHYATNDLHLRPSDMNSSSNDCLRLGLTDAAATFGVIKCPLK